VSDYFTRIVAIYIFLIHSGQKIEKYEAFFAQLLYFAPPICGLDLVPRG
jgi:hypothetical protein